MNQNIKALVKLGVGQRKEKISQILRLTYVSRIRSFVQIFRLVRFWANVC
jgi:hypothetical protein